MKLLSIPDMSKKTKIPESTLYDKLREGYLKDFGEKKSLLNLTDVLKFRPIIISLYNLKGGVGKTTTSALLSFYFSEIGKKVLCLDLDPQQNLSICYENFDPKKPNLYNFMDKFSVVEHKKNLLLTIIQNVYENIDLMASSIELVNKHDIHVEDSSQMKDVFIDVFSRYDIVIIDCPPNFTGLSKLGLLLSNYILMPLFAESFSFEGITLALQKMNDILKFNPDFWGFKAFVNKEKKRETSTKLIFDEKIREKLKDNIFQNSFPDFSAIDEVHATKENLFQVYKKKEQVATIKELFKEIENFIYEVE